MLFSKVSNIVPHRDTGKKEIMFRYVAGHGYGNRDLLSAGIIMRSQYIGATVAYGYRSVPYRVPTHLHICLYYAHTHMLPFSTWSRTRRCKGYDKFIQNRC